MNENQAATYCLKYQVVVNEIHHVDIQERNLTCVWDVLIPDEALVPRIEVLLSGVVSGAGVEVGRRETKYMPLAKTIPILFFQWQGSDDHLERPPKFLLDVLGRLQKALENQGFEVTLNPFIESLL